MTKHYALRKRNDKFQVVNKDTSEIVAGPYVNRASALSRIQKLYANEEAKKKVNDLLR